MKKVFFTLILCYNISFPTFAAENLQKYEKECLSIVNAPKVQVTSTYGKLKYDYQKDGAYLRRETAKKYKQMNISMPAGLIPFGLTKVTYGFDFNMTVSQINFNNGYICLYPEEIKTHLGYYNPTIYIINNLKKDSCHYKIALRHEKTHMQIFIEALDYFLPKFKTIANNLFKTQGVKIIHKSNANVTEEAAKLNNKYRDALKQKVDSWYKEIKMEQLKLDSVENYTIETILCQELDEK